MKSLLLFLFSFVFLNTTKWGSDFDKATEQAKNEKKLILLNFSGSDWCGPCIKLKQEVFETAGFSDFATKSLVLIRADFPRLKKNKLDKNLTIHNEKLADIYNKKGKFPLTVLIDTNGKVLKEWDGYSKDMNTATILNQIQAFL
jgi:thioredoxin-related protein